MDDEGSSSAEWQQGNIDVFDSNEWVLKGRHAGKPNDWILTVRCIERDV